jgi:hypothetical protein
VLRAAVGCVVCVGVKASKRKRDRKRLIERQRASERETERASEREKKRASERESERDRERACALVDAP